jgi:regulator of replication initiation timing
MHNRIKIIFSLFLVFISLSPFAQNKKQQIESLIIKNDSLLELVSKERKITFQKNIELDSVIFNLENQVRGLKKEINRINDEVIKKVKENENLKVEINLINKQFDLLNMELISKSDSINTLKLKISTDQSISVIDHCWEGISNYDTFITVDNKYFYIFPIDSMEFKNASTVNNQKYLLLDRNVQSSKTGVRITYANGKFKNFKNNLVDHGDYIQYSFLGSFKNIGYYILRVQLYEGIYYLLIDKDNGTEVKVLSEPVFSETGKYFACYNATCAGDDAGLQIFEVINKNKFKLIANELKNHFWDPSFVKWKGDNQLLFEKYRCPCELYKYSKLILK